MSHVVQLSELISEGQWRPECAICRGSVALEESKVDEHGKAIHEECYVSNLVGKKTTKEQNYMKL
ncbi:MAG: hypothetical protein ABR881_05465 [Candidatus Sulfotelmatobacter sp.]|jgi:hypothetical protein